MGRSETMNERNEKKLTFLSLTIVSAAGTYMDFGLWICRFIKLQTFKSFDIKGWETGMKRVI